MSESPEQTQISISNSTKSRSPHPAAGTAAKKTSPPSHESGHSPQHSSILTPIIQQPKQLNNTFTDVLSLHCTLRHRHKLPTNPSHCSTFSSPGRSNLCIPTPSHDLRTPTASCHNYCLPWHVILTPTSPRHFVLYLCHLVRSGLEFFFFFFDQSLEVSLISAFLGNTTLCNN